MNHRPSIRSHRGITLVEILTVILIVGTLATAAVHGFNTARTRANQAVSAANLRQLAAANLLYAADHQTYCPTDLDGRNRIRWHGGRSNPKDEFDPEKGLLSEYLGLSRSVGQCPQLERMVTASAFNEAGGGGYGYNNTYIGGVPDKYLTPNRPANVRSPEHTLMFATTAFAVAGGIQLYPSADPPSWVDSNWRLRGPLQPSIHFRFNGKALIAWCDGHVTEESPSNPGQQNFYGGDNTSSDIGFCGPSENNGWWNPRN